MNRNVKKVIIWAMLLTVSGLLKAQQSATDILLTGAVHNKSTTLCDGMFYDNKKNGNYAANIDYWTTFCPSTPNSRIRLDFETFDIDPTDTVRIYYGQSLFDTPALNQETGVNYFQNHDLEGKQISPPFSDLSGCITFRLTSDATQVAAGWKAKISCEANCQDVYAALDDTFVTIDANGNKHNKKIKDDFDVDTVEVKDPKKGYTFIGTDEWGNKTYYRVDTIHFKAIDICYGDSVVLKAKPEFPDNDVAYHQTPQSCVYIWGLGDNDNYDTVFYNPEIGHKWLKVSGYDINLYMQDTNNGGCVAKNTIEARVRISQNMIKTVNTIPDFCSGSMQKVYLSNSDGTATIVVDSVRVNQTEREIFETRFFIPDGGSNPTGNGCYETEIVFTNFGPGVTLSQGNEIVDLCINMEHSSVGDLSMELICPNGQSTTLKYFMQYPLNTFLGVPAGTITSQYINASSSDGTPITDSNANPSGECWQYCWSNVYTNSAQGVLFGTSGYTTNIVKNKTYNAAGNAFNNNVLDSTHFWSMPDTVSLSTFINANMFTVLDGNSYTPYKGGDTVFRLNGDIVTPPIGTTVTFEEGDEYKGLSTGHEYVGQYTETQTLVQQTGVGYKVNPLLNIAEEGYPYPALQGDSSKYHVYSATIYPYNASVQANMDSIYIVNGNTVEVIDIASSSQTVTYDSIVITDKYYVEYRQYEGMFITAEYGDYVRNDSYNYVRDSIFTIGEQFAFFQTPKQGITGSTIYTQGSVSQSAWDAITPDLNGFDPLIGCPLNGAWTIRICDYTAKNNGWICSWWMDVELASATEWTYTVPIDHVVWGGPYVKTIDSVSAIISPGIKDCGEFLYDTKVVDAFGCEWPAPNNVSIICTPVVDLGPDKEVCEGKSVTLNAGNAGATQYIWEPTGEHTQTIKVNPDITVGTEKAKNSKPYGDKQYIAMVTNSNDNLSCTGQDTIIVKINKAAAAAFTADFPLEGCEPYTFTLHSQSPDAAKFEWKIGDDYLSSDSDPTFTLPYGDYSLDFKVTTSAGCEDAIHTDNMVNVFKSPAADFGWEPSVPYASAPYVTMINLTTPEDESSIYRWEVQTNKNNPYDFENVFGKTPQIVWHPQEGETVAGEYTVTLDASTYNQAPSGKVYECHDTVTKVVTIINDNLIFPTALTPNGDGYNDVFEIHNLLVGQAFPDNELTIYNRLGKRIYFAEDIRNPEQFWDPDKTNSPTGTYFYRFIGRGPIRNVEYKGTVEVLRD